jgi:hypothetical protein
MHETMLVGHGDAVEAGCQVVGLNNLADGKDAVVKELAIIGRPDHKIYRHGNAFIQFGNKHGVEGSRRKHVWIDRNECQFANLLQLIPPRLNIDFHDLRKKNHSPLAIWKYACIFAPPKS